MDSSMSFNFALAIVLQQRKTALFWSCRHVAAPYRVLQLRWALASDFIFRSISVFRYTDQSEIGCSLLTVSVLQSSIAKLGSFLISCSQSEFAYVIPKEVMNGCKI